MSKKTKRARPWDGSWWKRADGRYGAELPYRTLEGVRYWSTTQKTEDGVKRWLNRKRYDRDQETLPPPDAEGITVAEYLGAWLRSIRNSVSRHTHRDYSDKVRLHIVPKVGRIKLKKLTSADLQMLYDEKLAEGLSPRSVRYIHTTMSKALQQAWGQDYVSKNVARWAKPPSPSHDEREPMSLAEAKAFLAEICGDRFEALYLLAVTTAMRRGELFGLKWSDLDLEAGEYRVRRSLDTLYGPATERDPKRRASRRPGVLLPEIVASLKEHKRRQLEDRLRAGPRWEDNDYVFPTAWGTPQRADNVLRRSLKPLCERAGIRPLTFTDLRHSVATFLVVLNIHPRVAQRMLGHSDVTTTLAVYSHAPDEAVKEAASRLGELLFGDPAGAEK